MITDRASALNKCYPEKVYIHLKNETLHIQQAFRHINRLTATCRIYPAPA